MKIYLKHPKHGEKIAYYEAEAEADKKNGWVEYTPDENKPKRGRPRKED